MKKWFSKLGTNFKSTSNTIKNALSLKKHSEEDLSLLGDSLIKSDLGVIYVESIINNLRKSKIEKNSSISHNLIKLLEEPFHGINQSIIFKPELSPQVILIIGVNGSGKTTSIAKLAHKIKQEGKNVTIAAGDTFRAAANEQLLKWADLIGVDVVSGKPNEDPSSVIYKSHIICKKKGNGVLLIDTAGRLHTKVDLMDELEKIVRTIKKNDPTAPHNTILVLDSTIGQNSYNQVEMFNKKIGISGLIMTKLDGSAKGGSLIGITEKFKLPIHAIGIGEGSNDLINFNPSEFVRALVGYNEEKSL